MKPVEFACSVLAVWVGLAGAGRAFTKPNLLFILTDEQRHDTLRAYGNEVIQTPNLDRLARNGVVFRRAYVSQPICSPARSTILTGLWPHQTGVTANNIPLRRDARALPQLVNDPAYRTAFMGKWHLGDELQAQHGFQQWLAIEDGYTIDGAERSAYHHWLVEHGFQPDTKKNSFSRGFSNRLPLEYSKPAFLEQMGSAFLEQNRDRPFVLYLSFLHPHTPNFGPLDQLHRPQDVTLAPTVGTPLAADAPLRYRLMRAVREARTGRQWQEEIARYWGMVAQVDRSVGGVLDKLKVLGLDGNTIVVFTSEHGKQLGEHGLWYKGVLYESSCRVPWIIKAPGIGPRVVDRAVSQIDLVPTLLELMGKPPAPSLPGRSLVPVMKGEKADHGDVFVEWNPSSGLKTAGGIDGIARADVARVVQERTRAVITQDGWKLCLSDVDRAQLFNLEEDPYESRNLFSTAAYRDKVKSLAQKILAWQRATGDQVSGRKKCL